MQYSTREQFLKLAEENQSFMVISSTEWCPNCKHFDSIVSMLPKDLDISRIIKIDPEETGLSKQLGIHSIPSLSIFIKGSLDTIKVGLVPSSELAKLITEITNTINKYSDEDPDDNSEEPND